MKFYWRFFFIFSLTGFVSYCDDGYVCLFKTQIYQLPVTQPIKQQFDVVYLNLERNKIRANHMEKLLNFANLKFSRFDAVDGSRISSNNSYLDTVFGKQTIKLDLKSHMENSSSIISFKKLGAIGCWLSYLLLMRKIIQTASTQPVVILEDDIDLDVDFAHYINATIKSAPDDWDVLLCGYCCLIASDYKSKSLRGVKSYYATHCFIVRNASTAAKIEKRLDVTKVAGPVDKFFSEMAAEKYLNIYAFRKQIAVQLRNLFETNIPTSGKFKSIRLKKSLFKNYVLHKKKLT